MENHEQYKLVTRRFLFWGFATIATLTLAFIAVWGTLNNIIEYVTLAGGGLLTELGVIIGFLAKKLTEE